MATQAMQRLPQFNSQNMSNTLWAFASLNHHPGPMLLKVLQRELVHKLPHFTSQGIENVLWAFATLGHHPGQPATHREPNTVALCTWRHLQLPAPCVESQHLHTTLTFACWLPQSKGKYRVLACGSAFLLLLSLLPKHKTALATSTFWSLLTVLVRAQAQLCIDSCCRRGDARGSCSAHQQHPEAVQSAESGTGAMGLCQAGVEAPHRLVG